MSKTIPLDGTTILIAPDMEGGYKESGEPYVKDYKTGDILDPTEISSKIRIYEREVLEWFIEPAKNLLERNSTKNSFIVLMVCMSYIEGVEQYKAGESSNRQSRQFFINSVNRIYPEIFTDIEIQQLYSKSRCGLFHNGMVSGGVIFNNQTFEHPIEFENEVIKINPNKLLTDIEIDFSNYIQKLNVINSNDRETTELQQNFDSMFTVIQNNV